jgi:deoxyribodipyrimidine photo-lyase
VPAPQSLDESGHRTAGPALVWFRNDLRLADNPALVAAAATGRPLVAVYIHDKVSPGLRADGAAAHWWLGRSLAALKDELAGHGVPLVIRAGAALDVLSALIAETGAGAVHWNRRYDAAGIAVDKAVKARLKADGIAAESHNGALLYEPWTVTGKSGTYLKVFTPFWKAARATGEPPPPRPFPALRGTTNAPAGLSIADLATEPVKPDWAGGLRAMWTPGEAGARACLDRFLDGALDGYGENRNRPDFVSTSRLSPHLRFGEVSLNTVWHAAIHAVRSGRSKARESDLDKFHFELGWREFAYHLLYHFPGLPSDNFQPRFDGFPWRDPAPHLNAWQKGRTGFPVVDAGMRELWQTGWMHNRVRMIVGSFLVKHLLIDWRHGENWFWDTLVDADPANNTASWQWVAGTGADAAPYFRVFNPVIQGEKFDPDGAYVRAFVPELARMPAQWIHKPWDAPRDVLAKAGVTLGLTYPHPIVDHARARDDALAAFASLKPLVA